jgi:hypothetical protein
MATQKVIRQRVEEILNLRLLGALPTDLRRHAEEAGWNVSDRQLQRYTATADKLMAEALAESRPGLKGYHFAARRALFARTVSVSDYRTALSVLKDEAELLDLYPAKKSQVSGPDGGPIRQEVQAHHEHSIADVDRMAAILRALADAGALSPGVLGQGNDPAADEVRPAHPASETGGLPPAASP